MSQKNQEKKLSLIRHLIHLSFFQGIFNKVSKCYHTHFSQCAWHLKCVLQVKNYSILTQNILISLSNKLRFQETFVILLIYHKERLFFQLPSKSHHILVVIETNQVLLSHQNISIALDKDNQEGENCDDPIAHFIRMCY